MQIIFGDLENGSPYALNLEKSKFNRRFECFSGSLNSPICKCTDDSWLGKLRYEIENYELAKNTLEKSVGKLVQASAARKKPLVVSFPHRNPTINRFFHLANQRNWEEWLSHAVFNIYLRIIFCVCSFRFGRSRRLDFLGSPSFQSYSWLAFLSSPFPFPIVENSKFFVSFSNLFLLTRESPFINVQRACGRGVEALGFRILKIEMKHK